MSLEYGRALQNLGVLLLHYAVKLFSLTLSGIKG